MGTLGGHISPAPSHSCSPTTAHTPAAENKQTNKQTQPKLRVYSACPFWFCTPRGRAALASAPNSAEASCNDRSRSPTQCPFKNPGGAGGASLQGRNQDLSEQGAGGSGNVDRRLERITCSLKGQRRASFVRQPLKKEDVLFLSLIAVGSDLVQPLLHFKQKTGFIIKEDLQRDGEAREWSCHRPRRGCAENRSTPNLIPRTRWKVNSQINMPYELSSFPSLQQSTY